MEKANGLVVLNSALEEDWLGKYFSAYIGALDHVRFYFFKLGLIKVPASP
jgi:hypothetical protein